MRRVAAADDTCSMTNPSGETLRPDAALVAYVTCPDLDEARRIGRVLVEEGLAACVNIHAHETIYRWEGILEQGPEAMLLAKTTRAAWPALQARVRALHSAALPCIVAWRLDAGLPEYLDWIGTQVAAR